MEKNPDQDNEVHYVEAEPIEVTAEPVDGDRSVGNYGDQQYFKVYTANRQNCNPCCGPTGCLLIILLFGYLVVKSEFLQNMILAGVLTLGIMSVMMALTRRR